MRQQASSIGSIKSEQRKWGDIVDALNQNLKDELILMLLDLGYTKLSDGRQLYELTVGELEHLYLTGNK